MRLSIRKKIFFVILLPALLLLLLIYLDYRNLLALGKSADRILSNNYQSIKAAQEIRRHVQKSRNEILFTILEDKTIQVQALRRDKGLEDLFLTCRRHIAEEGEEKIVDSLFRLFAAYNDAVAAMAKKQGHVSGKEELHDLATHLEALLAGLDELILLNEQGMEKHERDTREFAARAVRYSVGLFLAALLCTLVLSTVLSARISRPLVRLARSLASVKEGSGVYPSIPVTADDEIGFLSTEFNRLFDRLKAYDQASSSQLMAEKMKVVHAETAKEQFIADLSHQLKTPMTSLSMSLGMLADPEYRLAPEKKEKLLEMAREDCTRLGALINELVDTARLDSMMTHRDREPRDLGSVIEECVKPLQLQAEEKGVVLEMEMEAEMPRVRIDAFRFPWVITNLVGNAIRHTDSGGRVLVSARREGDRCYVRCSDTGIGIDPRFLPRIFDRYTQFSEPGKGGASGLGLAIAKQIIEQHGGEITVESELARGTTFTLWIPL